MTKPADLAGLDLQVARWPNRRRGDQALPFRAAAASSNRLAAEDGPAPGQTSLPMGSPLMKLSRSGEEEIDLGLAAWGTRRPAQCQIIDGRDMVGICRIHAASSL